MLSYGGRLTVLGLITITEFILAGMFDILFLNRFNQHIYSLLVALDNFSWTDLPVGSHKLVHTWVELSLEYSQRADLNNGSK